MNGYEYDDIEDLSKRNARLVGTVSAYECRLEHELRKVAWYRAAFGITLGILLTVVYLWAPI